MTNHSSAAKKLRVAMLAEYPYEESDLIRGGVLQANYRLIHALGKLDEIELHVLMPTTKVDKLVMRHEGNAVLKFFPLRNRGYGALLRYPGIRKSFRSLLDDVRPDLIHVQAVPAYILAALDSKVPSVVTIHGVYRNELAVNKMRRSLREKLAAEMVTRIQNECFGKIKNLIAITDEIENLVRESSPGACVYRINNAIDERFYSLANRESHPAVLFVGWINKRKGVHILLDAFCSVVQSIPAADLRLVGQEDLDREFAIRLKAKYQELVASGRVRFLGSISQEQLYCEMSRCSILCLPSLAESAPMVIAQAMAAAKPVVATRVGGIPNMVEDGATGLLCDPDNPGQLAENLIALLKNDEARRNMGQVARQQAEAQYRPDRVAQSTINAYRHILDNE